MRSSPLEYTLFPYTTLFRSADGQHGGPFPSCLASCGTPPAPGEHILRGLTRSEEHTSELQSLRHLECALHLSSIHSFPTRRSSDLQTVSTADRSHRAWRLAVRLQHLANIFFAA